MRSQDSLLRNAMRTRIVVPALLVLIVFSIALPIVPIGGAPITLTVSPTSGPVGSIVTVSGTDATQNGEVRLYINDSFFVASTTASATGEYSIDITIPSLSAGTYSLMTLNVATGETNSASLTIQPKVVLNPADGAFNRTVKVYGEGFQNSTLITIAFNETDVTPSLQPQTDDLGSFETHFNVPLMPNGTYPVTASDGTNSASAAFAVVPKITLRPRTSGSPSSRVSVTGTGFAPATKVTVRFDALNVTTYDGIMTSVEGSFGIVGGPAIFFVPDIPDGTYTISAIDEIGNSATAPFTVPSPVMVLTPNVTSGASIVTVTGSGFQGPIMVTINSTANMDIVYTSLMLMEIFPDEYGSFEYSFILPITQAGSYNVTANRIVEMTAEEFMQLETVAWAALTIVDLVMDRLVGIQGNLALIQTDVGTIRANLDTINATLVNIEGTTVTINSTLGTIQTDITSILSTIITLNKDVAKIQTTLGTIEGTVASIDGNMVEIITSIGPLTMDISSVKQAQDAFTTPLYILTALASISAIGVIILIVQTRRRSMPRPKRIRTKP